jgi:RHS repeat-associated protein
MAGRESSVQDVADGISYVSGPCTNVDGGPGACYAPTGALASDAHGQGFGGSNGITETWGYNNRLEATSISATSSNGTPLDLSYSYAADGSVSGFTDNLDNGRNEGMTYDGLNRLQSAATGATSGQDCWGLNFGDDPWDNLLSMSPSKCTAPNLGVGVSGSNWIDSPSGFQYDAAGNMTNDGQYSYSYDAEGRIASANGVSYSYDPEGDRAEKSNGTLYFRDLSGRVLSESDLSGTTTQQYVYFDGRRIAATGGMDQPNGGFEQGSAYWTDFWGGAQLVTGDPAGAHSGSSYVEISGNGNVKGEYVPVIPGEVVTFGGWAYYVSGSTGYMNWDIEAVDSSYNLVAYVGASPWNVTTSNWVYQSGTYTVPSGVAYVFLYVQVWGTTDGAVGKFDDGFLNLGGIFSYYFSDATGSVRAATDASGNVCFDADYYPYGQENDYNTSCEPEFRFAGMEYDSETGNYYDHARYYNPRLGRFMSPDPMSVSGFSNPDNPQSWNGYAYTLNNPETLVDPSGACVTSSVDGSVVGQSQGGMWEGPCSPPAANDNSFGPGDPLWWAYVESHFSPAAFPPVVYRSGPLPLPPTQPQTPTQSLAYKLGTVKLEAAVFAQGTVRNFADEFKQGGCVSDFLNSLAGGAGSGPSPAGPQPEDLVRATGTDLAFSYAAANVLAYPLRSSAYRGILSGTETAAGAVSAAFLDLALGTALRRELEDLSSGVCR